MGGQNKEGALDSAGSVTRGVLRAHLHLLLLPQNPEHSDLLLIPGHDTQHLVPAGRQRGHREGTLGWGSSTPAQRVGKCISCWC